MFECVVRTMDFCNKYDCPWKYIPASIAILGELQLFLSIPLVRSARHLDNSYQYFIYKCILYNFVHLSIQERWRHSNTIYSLRLMGGSTVFCVGLAVRAIALQDRSKSFFRRWVCHWKVCRPSPSELDFFEAPFTMVCVEGMTKEVLLASKRRRKPTSDSDLMFRSEICSLPSSVLRSAP
jgi:hypothetical protein